MTQLPMRNLLLLILLGTFSSLSWAQDSDTFLLEIKGLEPGIDVIINGQQLGFTPFAKELPRAEIKLELQGADWEPYTEILPPPTKRKLTISPKLTHSRSYELRSLQELRTNLAEKLDKKRQARATWDIVGYISLGLLASGITLAGTSAIASSTIEPQYQAATTSADASLYRSQIEGWNTAFNIGLGVGIGGAASGIVTLMFSPEIKDSQAQLDSIDRQIKTLEVPQ